MFRSKRFAAFVLVAAVLAGLLIATPRLLAPNVPQMLEEARHLAVNGRTSEAVVLLDRILQQQPRHSEALLLRGQAAREQNDPGTARRLWSMVPDDPAALGGTARYLEATLLLQESRARDAERRLLQALELHPDYLQPRDRLVELYVAQMRTGDVRRQLVEIRKRRRWTIEELVLHELVAERVTEVAKGVALMSTFVAADPDDVGSSLALGRYYMADGRHEAARDLLARLLQRRPTDGRVAGLLAEAHLNLHDLAAAGATLEEPASQADEAGGFFWRSSGRYWMELGNWNNAAASYGRLAEADPDNLEACHQYGVALQRMGKSNQAEHYLQRAVSIDGMRRQADRIPNGQKTPELLLPIVLDVAGKMDEMKRHEEAAWWFEQALVLNEHDASAMANYQRCLSLAASRRAASTVPGPTSRSAPPRPTFAAGTPSNRLTASMPVEPPRDSRIELNDVAAQVGLKFAYFNGQTGLKYLVESMGGGVAVLDYDLDGWPDIYLAQGCPLPFDDTRREQRDRLFRNTGEGRFEDVSEQAGLGDHRYGQGCTAGDYDNDGDPDLVVANFGRNVFYCNNGDGTFTDITEPLGMGGEKWSSAVAFADLDRDGNLDLYLANYVDSLRVCRAEDGRVATCDPHNFGGEQDRLYRNRGDGSWDDITERSGIVAKDGKGLGLLLADLDGDGRDDIYVANDGTPNFLFRNVSHPQQGIRFEDYGRLSGTAVSSGGEAEAGMGVACADLNYDGLLDLYVTNFHLESNTLYLNLGDMLFIDATRSLGLAEPTLPVLGFGVQALDLDADGRWELFVANGHIDDLRHRGDPWKMRPQLFREAGRGRYKEISSTAGDYFAGEYLGRGVASIDWDRDRDVDLIVVHQQGPVSFLQNDTSQPGGRFMLRLVGIASNRDAVGVRVTTRLGGRTMTRVLTAGDGFFSCNERRMMIGTGDFKTIDELQVQWPSGRIDRFQDLDANMEATLLEGGRLTAETR